MCAERGPERGGDLDRGCGECVVVVVVVVDMGSEGDDGEERRLPKTPRLLSSMGWKSMRARRLP